MKYKVSTINKNCVIEKEVWQFKDGNRMSYEKGYNWGNIILNKLPNLQNYDENQGISVWHAFEEELETNRYNKLWTKWVFPFVLSKHDKDIIIKTWREDSYKGLEQIGWLFVGRRLWFYGPLEVEIV